MVTLPFFFAEATVFDAVTPQLVLGVADHAQAAGGGDGMVSGDRKYVTLDILRPIPKVESLDNFNHQAGLPGLGGMPGSGVGAAAAESAEEQPADAFDREHAA